MNPDELLAHAGFVHSLARSLVRDEHHAADVEQRTWLAALEHPPTSDKNIKSWFSRVIKNFVITMYRGETRRMKYENALEHPESITSPEEISIRKEALKKMSEAVFNLEEPYFSTVLLRFYEDLPASKVAERLGVPLETVKTRLQRALKILKKDLDEKHNGNRKEWCLALAAVAGVNVAAASSVSAAVTASGSSAAPAAAAVSVKFKLCLIAALFVGTTFTLFQFFADSTLDSEALDPIMAKAPADESGKVVTQLVAEEEQAVAIDTERETLIPLQTLLAGKVTDLVTGEPITAFDIKVKRFAGVGKGEMPVHETVYTEDGTFSIAIPEAGTYDVEFNSSRFSGKRMTGLEIPEKTGIQDLQIQLNPGLTLSGRVVDDATDEPVAGALVGPADHFQETDIVSISILGYEEDGIHTYSDATGEFLLEGLYRDNKIAVIHPDYAESHFKIDSKDPADVEVRLRKGYRIFGKAFDDEGNPAEGVLVHLLGSDNPMLRPTTTGPDGSFRTAPTLPGRIVIKAGEPDWEFKANPNFTEEYKIVEVVDSDVEIRLGPSPDLVTLSGTLYDFDGTPRAGGEFSLTSGDHTPWTAGWYRLVRTVKCDDEGRFLVEKLHAGRHRVIFQPPGQLPFEWGILALDTPGEIEMDINLSHNASCSGSVIDALTGEPCINADGNVWAVKSSSFRRRPLSAKLDSDGKFEIRGLSPGSYTISGRINGLFTKRLTGVNIKKGDHLTGLQLELAPSGSLKFKLDGFDDSRRSSFNLYLSGGESNEDHHFRYRLASGGDHEKTLPLHTGSWTLTISFPDFGFVQRPFEVFANQETSLGVHRDELYIRPEPLSIQGLVAYPDGTPAQNLSLTFRASSVPGLEDHREELQTRIAQDGSYVLENLMPGRWRIKARLNDNAWIDFPSVWIAPDATDPYILPLTLARGCVTGSLFNGLEQRPITFDSETTWKWQAYLHNVEEDRRTGGFESANVDDNLFFLYGAPAGNYQLIVKADGYEDYESEAFTLQEGEVFDMDRIMLNPCGVLNVEVVDELFLPVKRFSLSCEGHRRHYNHSAKGIRRYDNLPVGLVTIKIDAKGYKTQRIKVQLEPASPVETRVILTREVQ